MPPARSRFSHRHLLALSTFLVPLAILAALGWSELQRSSSLAQAARSGEAREFVRRARQAVDQRINQAIRRAFSEEAIRRVVEDGPVRAAFELQRHGEHPALRSILLLTDQSGVRLPGLPVRDPHVQGLDVPPRFGSVLTNVEYLLLADDPDDPAHPRTHEAVAVLEGLLASLGPTARNPRPQETESTARLWLGAAMKRLGNRDEAVRQFRAVLALPTRGFSTLPLQNHLAAAAELATFDGPAARLAFLRTIGSEEYSVLPDGHLSAIFDRTAATFAADDPRRADVDRLYDEDVCRANIRKFASDYESFLKGEVLRRRSIHAGNAEPGSPEGADDEQILVTRIPDKTALVAIRLADESVTALHSCTYMAVHFDLDAMLAPLWQQFAGDNSTFVLSVIAPDKTPLVPPPAAQPLDSAMATDSAHELTLLAFPADPAHFAAEAEASAGKRPLLILVLFVTALGGALWSWRSVTREAELAALKVDLVSRVSHELKTPLALVRMYGETLSLGRAKDSDQAAEFGAIIAREAERLTALIQRILDFSKQQAGTLNYAPEAVDLTSLLRNVVEAYGPHLEARGALLIDSLRHGVTVHCDPNACESAIVNLLENAAKYGLEGDDEHEIELDLATSDGRAIVEVRDRGRGIPPAERERVFDGFYRASNSGEVRGAGLGLSLVRHFARAHGGDVQAQAREGGGTVMRLWLPRLAATTPSPAAATDQPAGRSPAADP